MHSVDYCCFADALFSTWPGSVYNKSANSDVQLWNEKNMFD